MTNELAELAMMYNYRAFLTKTMIDYLIEQPDIFDVEYPAGDTRAGFQLNYANKETEKEFFEVVREFADTYMNASIEDAKLYHLRNNSE